MAALRLLAKEMEAASGWTHSLAMRATSWRHLVWLECWMHRQKMELSWPTRWSHFSEHETSLHSLGHLWCAHRQGVFGPMGCFLMEHLQGACFWGCARHVEHNSGHGSTGISIARIGIEAAEGPGGAGGGGGAGSSRLRAVECAMLSQLGGLGGALAGSAAMRIRSASSDVMGRGHELRISSMDSLWRSWSAITALATWTRDERSCSWPS